MLRAERVRMRVVSVNPFNLGVLELVLGVCGNQWWSGAWVNSGARKPIIDFECVRLKNCGTYSNTYRNQVMGKRIVKYSVAK